ncbi:hypothetical protein EG329_000558 [Mollisiaceae sp. DMI_Dod_QoI]|nr:hypothetical protein EG329_000558 [Helotiales sp. DMI_Dod_QoI]
MAEPTKQNSTPGKRIILCLDGTFDDTADTADRVNPGSFVSRLFRWILPPIFFMILWGLGVFPYWKKLERKLFGRPPTKTSFHTNVSLLASAIQPLGDNNGANQIPQLVIYIGGIGGVGTPQSRFEEAVTGNTMASKVRHAYRLIVDNYCEGDEIFLFGFSRGAFTARAIAGFIHCFGLLKKHYITQYFDEVWELYKDRKSTCERLEKECEQTSDGSELKNLRYQSNQIRCIGVWDAVGSLGAPPLWAPRRNNHQAIAEASRARYKFFDPELKDNVEYAFQALALDEQRFDFYPAVWSKPKDMKDPHFSQVWFPGVHTDVGGGRAGSVSRYAFIWMASKIQEHGLLDLDVGLVKSISLELQKTDEVPDRSPPWELEIGRNHWVYPFIGRLGYRKPHMPVGRLAGSERGGVVEQKFHWTVVNRIIRVPQYWIDCKALGKVDGSQASIELQETEDIKARQETSVLEDAILEKKWCPNTP